jgi:hypothetical protein
VEVDSDIAGFSGRDFTLLGKTKPVLDRRVHSILGMAQPATDCSTNQPASSIQPGLFLLERGVAVHEGPCVPNTPPDVLSPRIPAPPKV